MSGGGERRKQKGEGDVEEGDLCVLYFTVIILCDSNQVMRAKEHSNMHLF